MPEIRENIPLAGKTTLRVGGPARWYCEPGSRDQFIEAVRWAALKNAPVFMLGNGSNTVVSDRGWPGLVVSLSPGYGAIEWRGGGAICQAGALLPALVREAMSRGLGGIEKLGGIPGTVGAAAMINAGAWGQSIGAVTTAVEWYDPAAARCVRTEAAQLMFGYRGSCLRPAGALVLEVELALAPADPAMLRRGHAEAMEKRRRSQPIDRHNCGSVFRNPEGDAAGRLIDRCGLKGAREGGIGVSPMHANFFINDGTGTAAQFRTLVARVQRTVHETTGVLLEPEVVFAGAFDAPLYEPAPGRSKRGHMNVQIRRFVTGPLETNSYLVTDTEGHALVFDPSSGCGAVIDECGRLEVSPAAVILTHGHFDHCMGLAEMTKAFPAAAVYIHPADLFMLRQAQMNGSYLIGEPFAWDGPVRELPEGAVTIGGFAMEVTRCPGHSPGGCIVRFGDQCITGDVIFAGSIGRSDFAGGDAEALLAGIRGHILTLPAETVLWPGHGGRTTAGREKRMNPFLQP